MCDTKMLNDVNESSIMKDLEEFVDKPELAYSLSLFKFDSCEEYIISQSFYKDSDIRHIICSLYHIADRLIEEYDSLSEEVRNGKV